MNATLRPSLWPSLWTSLWIGLWIGLCVLAMIAVRHQAVTATLAGGFPESDDMMRLVQVRDWLAGQGWGDLRQTRLGPDSNFPMHWTRVIDVPLAGVFLILSAFLSPENAEIWTRVLFPSACLALTLVGGLSLGRTLGLIDASAAAAAPLLIGLSLALVYTQFQPGRIDHHGPQIALLMFVYSFALRAYDPAKAASAGLAGLLAALSIAISVETAPLLGAACLGLVVRWLWIGGAAAPALRWLGAGLAGGFAAFYLVFAPGGAQAAGACDALSSAWLTAGLAGGGSLIALALAAGTAHRSIVRLIGLALAGLLILAIVWLLHPACLRHPYSGMDPVVVEAWLSKVTEARSIWGARSDLGMQSHLVPAILGSLGLVWACASAKGLARARWLGLCAIAAIGWGLAAYEVRALPPLVAVASFGGVFAALELAGRAHARFGLVPAWKFVALMPLFPLTWAGVLNREPAVDSQAPPSASVDCFARGPLASIAREAPALVLSTVDLGAFVLVNTSHRVLSAPYHRNVAGNKSAIETFLADPMQAHARVKTLGARFLLICPSGGDAQILAKMAPAGLAARLMGGDADQNAIDWLIPLHKPGAPLRIFEVR